MLGSNTQTDWLGFLPCTKSATLRVRRCCHLHLSLCTSPRSLKTAAAWKLGTHIILTLPLTMQGKIYALIFSTWHMPGRLDLAHAFGAEAQRKRSGACVRSGELMCSRGKCSDQEKRHVSLLGADRTDRALQRNVSASGVAAHTRERDRPG